MPLAATNAPVPSDLKRLGDTRADVVRYEDFLTLLQDGSPLTVYQLVQQLLRNTDIDILLKTLGLGFKPRVVTVSPTAREVIPPHQYARGYIILNPAEISGQAQQVTPFASASRAAGTYNSTSFNVTAVDTVRAFLDVTVQGAGATLTVALQTQDPLTGNWVTAVPDIFSGSAAVGTYYALLGPLGIDRLFRFQAVVAVNSITFSLSGLLKGGITSPVGTTVYLGPPSVNTTMGYPILPGAKETLYLKKNVTLWGVTATETLVLKVFELQ